MKAKKLLSILLLSILACMMLAVYASAAEVDTYYFAGDYLRWRVYNNTTDLKNAVSTVDGALHISDRADGQTGAASFRFNTANGAASEISTSAYPYITAQFKTKHSGDVQFWPFSQQGPTVDKANGAKLHNGSYQNDAWQNMGITNDGNWWTAKLSFASGDMSTNATLGTASFTPNALENSTKNWAAKTNGNLPTYYDVVTVCVTDGSANANRFADIKYIAIHSKKADMYGSDGMDAMLDVVAFGDEVITYYIASTATENDLKAYIKSAIETEFDGAVVTVGNQLSDKTFATNATKEYTYLVTVEYEGVKAYDGFNINVVPMPTFDALDTLGAQIRTSVDSYDLRFGFTIDTAAIPTVCTLVEYGAVIGKEGSTPVLGNENEYAVVRSTNQEFKVKETAGTVNTYTAVVDNIPDENSNVGDQRGTALVARPYLTYKVNGENYTVYGDSITRSYNEVVDLATGEWDKD